MADRGCESSFFQYIHLRIDIFISVRPKITKFGRQVHLQDLTQMRLIRQVLVTSSHQDQGTNYNHISTTRVLMAAKLGTMGTCPCP